jgi:hypothetical protein
MRHSHYPQPHILICKRVSTLLTFNINAFYRPSYGYIVDVNTSTLALISSYQVPAAFDYHSFTMDEYYDDFLFIGVNGNAIEMYGIEWATRTFHYTVTLKDMGSQNYMAQGYADNGAWGWYMYTYGSAGKLFII